MKTTKIRQIRKNMILLLTLLVMSIHTTWAQALKQEDITEDCDFVAGTISFTIPEGNSDCTWKVDEKAITEGIKDEGRTLTLEMSQSVRKVEVAYTAVDLSSQTLSFDVEPKIYGKEYNGVKFYADKYAGGSGKKEDPYIISSDLQLAKLANDVNTGSSMAMKSGEYFKLTKDIDLKHGIWTPIGSTKCIKKDPDRYFAGIFDGDGHAIRNMHIEWDNETGKEASWGLFSRLYGNPKNDKSPKLEEYATVTNLVIENALVEKKKGYIPQGTSVIKIGMVASDLTQFAEISNIIIRDSKITDNGEKYAYKGNFRVGGIVGYVDNKKNHFRIFNISAETKMNMHKDNSSFTGQMTIAGGIGYSSTYGTYSTDIQPTHLYFHGPQIQTKTNSTKISRGSLFVFADKNNPNLFSNEIKNTWFFTSANEVSGTNSYNYGVKKDIAENGTAFVKLNNDWINENKLDKKTWTYTDGKFAFSSINLKLDRGKEDMLKVYEGENTEPSTALYDWYVSTDNINWEPVKTASSTYSLPRQLYDQYVYATDGKSRTNAVLVKAIHVEASLSTSKNSTNGITYTVNVTNDTEEKYDNDKLGLKITYQWYKGESALAGETKVSYTRPTEATHNDKFRCYVTVILSSDYTFSKWVSATTVVYLKPAQIASDKTISESVEIKNLEDEHIKDTEWGYSENKPMLTWKGAYSKLSDKASWDENIIVLMGKSSKELTNDQTYGFNITKNIGTEILTGKMWSEAQKSPLLKNVTITGKYNQKEYKDACIEITGLGQGLTLWGDTRFEHVTFNNGGGEAYKNIFCQYNNLEMGDSIKMTGFNQNSTNYGTIDGAVTTPMQIFGGFNNDSRFYPLNNKDSIDAFNHSMPHRKEGFSITIKSGFYSAICVGGRQAQDKKEQLNGVMGTPTQPIKCTITMDIDRKWNDGNNEKRTISGVERTNDYDAGIILAGNHEGAMYADVDIIIKSGKVARIVNGTLGAQSEFTLDYEGKTYNVPLNTFMGRANILLDPAHSENNNDTNINNRVIVTELYGGSMGRGHTSDVKINNPFYGKSTITINGGTFKILPEGNTQKSNILCGIFGAGAGGMNGIGTDTHHTPDERIAYWNTSKEVMLYGPYDVAKNNLISYTCYNADEHKDEVVDPRDTNTKIIINGGVFGSEAEKIDGIYAGGSGYMSPGLWTNSGTPSKTGGNVYGNTKDAAVSLTINGGTFYCENGIFAGGRGTDKYYSSNPYGGKASDYTALGQTYGNVELNINGGIFHCPIFGGGYGVADAKLYVPKNTTDTNTITTLSNMARIYGKSNVTINGGFFYQNIYGGGDMAVVENEGNDATNITIGGDADIRGSVFAGGNGRTRRLTGETFDSKVENTKSPDLVGKVIGNTNVNFTGSTQQAPYIYGDIYGGGNLAQVQGSTNVIIYAAHFAGQIFGGGKGNITDKDGKALNDSTQFTFANVTGNTYVNLAHDFGEQKEGDDGKPKDSFSINVIWNKIWDATNKKILEWNPKGTGTEPNRLLFFASDVVDSNKEHFLNPHNIYGGGNLACNVGGTAVVEVLKGMTPFDLLKTEEWKISYNDNKFPHFSVFGGGYGEYTTVANTDVTVNVEGEYGNYDAEVDDDTEQMARPRNRKNAKQTTTIPVFDNSKGIPNFTILGVLGGGYAGTVTQSTKVTVDGQTFLHRVYGGGFGDPYQSKDNATGQVGKGSESSHSEVYVQGGNIYGDVFGGGAGVAPKKTEQEEYVYFTNVARVKGTTFVQISDDAKIYGKVYGGGDIANVGKEDEDYTPDYTKKPTSITGIDPDTGKIDTSLGYQANDYSSRVDIIGGDIFGSVFGGGKGLPKNQAPKYEKVGRINGNTLVHVANTAASTINSIALDYYGNTVPSIWYNIYGGCAYGTVDGNTLVHIEGGMLGRDIFGGGYGDLEISEENQDTQEVLGEKDANNKATYANILGNTKVQMDGGTWIWNQNADINGNITTWLAAQANAEKICNSITEFKEITEDLLKVENINELPEGKAKTAINRILTEKDTQEFFSFTNDKILSGSFKKNNNIYGGGNRACLVGTYTDKTKVKDGTGEAKVVINHSPLDNITDKNGESLSMFDFTTLPGLCWYISAKNVADPQFSVFGAGFGANTKVAKAKVYAQPGSHIDDNGVIDVDGAKFRYLSQINDLKTYAVFETSLYKDFQKVSKEDKILYYGSVDGTDSDPATFRRYRVSRLAWTLGVPGFSFQAIHGGGFSGYVTDSTYVETDCQLFCENIYGAGLGAVPFGEYTKGDNYNFGTVKGNSKIFIKSGFIGQNVYGGGAGVESVKKDGQFIDFPNMASVKETEVHIYGRKLTLKNTNNIEIDRTLILGSVYGGGDVANVLDSTLVNIRGAGIYSQVFAGGKGRLVTQCADAKQLGAIHGNTRLLIDRPGITYPYWTKDGGFEDPSSPENMAHPADTTNLTMLPLLMEKIYGGCQNGTVYGNTSVTVYDGRIGHGIYGGGLGSCDSIIVNGQNSLAITSADVKGNTHVYIKGGQAMLTSYWLADTRSWEPASIIDGITYSPQYNHDALKFKINHNIYAGGNIACVVGKDAHLTMEKGLLHDKTQVAYGVDKKFFETMAWKEIYNKVGSPHFCVFGGGYGEHTVIQGDTHVKIDMEEDNNRGHVDDIKKGEEYMHFLGGYSVMDIVGGGYSGKVVGNTHVEGSGGIFCRRVFGGGFYNSVDSTTVNIKAIDCHDIFGGGMMGDVIHSTAVNIGNPSVQNSNKAIFIHGNVYGGNDVSGYVNVSVKDGDFTDNNGSGTHINIYGGKIYGDVYGAGNGDYLYALDRKGNTQVTVNENYPLNPNDPKSETTPLVFTVPMRENMPSHKAASDALKMVNINSWRPMTNKVNIQIMGNSKNDTVLIKGDVYCGGNSATVLKVKVKEAATSSVETVGSVKLKIGSHVNIRSVFMGCNGDALFTASEDNNFMNKFQKLNGDYYDASKELNLADTIDWENDPSNNDIDILYLPTEKAQRPLVYPHLIDLYFQPVEMNIQGTLDWDKDLENCTIGSFYCGGNRGNMNIYPNANGKVVDYDFPEGLTITSKIVGGCNNANYDYKGKVTHEGGYLLGLAHSTEPFIKLTIKNKFEPTIVNNEAYQGGCVYGGCFKAGTVRGDVTIDLQSDMLAGKDKAKLEKSNDYLASNPEYSSLNVYGAGYGMESYVYGNTNIIMGNGAKCSEPKTTEDGKFLPCGVNGATGVSANFIYGGGQQGNVIGLSNVDILNGHVFRSVTGGSYSGYVYGSTQVKVGHPTYYKVKPLKNGRYILNRTDKKNIGLMNDDGNEKTPTIKQEIYLLAGELVSKGVYDDIVAINNHEEIKIDDKTKYFEEVKPENVSWDGVNINIDEAIYGGGYSLAQGTSVLANNTTVLKLTKDFNVNKAFTSSADHLEELKSLPDGTTAGFGGNTLILVGDCKTSEHITVSHQDMKVVELPDGTDLYGYYYKHYDDVTKDDYTYRFIYEPVTYFKNKEKPDKLEGCRDNVFYEYDSEGGIFGDGHLSYAQGFRSVDITGYGFAEHTIDNPKIINTLQRIDILRLEDNCFSLLGARDYTVNEINKTPYSIARVGEIKMEGKEVKTDTDGKLEGEPETHDSTSAKFKYSNKARNFMGLANNIHYVGAVYSNVNFSAPWHDEHGKPAADNISYQNKKQGYIKRYNEDKDISEFQERNNGTAKNMVGIASGYALKIQNVQEIINKTTQKMDEIIYYGPIYGIIEMNLISARPGEGGGYVYADNVHERTDGKDKDFLETTGNFVFPLNYTNKTGNNRFIVDDCTPKGFYSLENGKDPDKEMDIHYWYVTGYNYYYNAHITGYTYKEKITFDNDNSDGLTALAGLKPGARVKIRSWKMRSGHPVGDSEQPDDYQCDLEKFAPDMYRLYVGASDSTTFIGATSKDQAGKANKGFSAILHMSEKEKIDTIFYKTEVFNDTIQGGDAKIAFRLYDNNVNNATPEYYKAHLSKKCQATLVLESPVLNEDGSQKTDKDGKAVNYTYTIYLTIEYVEGPNFTGGITIDNCALPGEMIRLKKDKVKISADQAFAPNGYFWHIGKLLKDKKGEFVKDDKGDIQFEDGSSWLHATTTSKDTYKQGDKIDKDRNDLFAGAKYDKTTDYLDIPAYYFMNGYGVQLGVTMTGIKETVFPVNIAPGDTLVVHNYHQMDPHKAGIDLHLSEAIKRAQKESNFAEPRIYINDVSDLKAFINFVDTIEGNAQFILQSDLTIPKGYDGSKVIFKGILHGNGHIINGLGKDQALFSENQGKIYNLGLTTGSIAEKGNTKETSSTGEYHCCFEYAPASSPDTPIVYGWDGKKTEKSYTHDDFKYGKVAYDLNGYYLIAKQDNITDAEKTALKYVYDYYANGDYQYAHRTDDITGNNTGITYLRKGQDSDQPNYGQTETRHDKTHTIDQARAQGYQAATEKEKEKRTGNYLPLFNANNSNSSEPMNDFLFWGQSLQSTPADYPAKIASQQNKYMTNRVYRTDAYYGNTEKDYFHYNAYKLDTKHMGTFVHIPTTTAINFAATDRDEPKVYDNLTIKDEVTQNLLVYTAADNTSKENEAYDIVHQALNYEEKTQEVSIQGHHIVKTGEAFATPFLHLVERTANNENSEGWTCKNNDFCVPLEFSVTNHAWYVRKPMLYSENTTGAWEGISLPFTVQKAEASLNGEITHFYGTPTEDELANPATNTHTLHHEYWLRGLTKVNETENTATFQRPGTTEELFISETANAAIWNYQFSNSFFVNTYKDLAYRWDADSYYANNHEYKDYIPLAAGVPYIVRFTGEYYYEFDLSSKFYNSLLNKKKDPQTITFHAYGLASEEPQKKAIVIPITADMKTVSNGYAHRGTFAAKKVENGGIYALNTEGTAFCNTATSQTVMPFRTYLTKESANAGARSSAVPSVIRISETTGIDRIEPEINGNDDTPAGESLFIRPIGAHRVRIESTYATQLQVFSTTGQLYRILDVRPGTATYSGFPDGIYIFGNKKVMVK